MNCFGENLSSFKIYLENIWIAIFVCIIGLAVEDVNMNMLT